MSHGSGIRDIAELTDHSQTTIRRYLARFGEALTASHDRLVRGISPVRIQADELWSYVYAKRGRNINVENRKRSMPANFGAVYTWVAFDPDSKLVISWQIGDRGEKACASIMADLNSRIEGHVLISTDGHVVYENSISTVFGDLATHVKMEKEIKSWWNPETGEKGSRVSQMEKIHVSGKPVDLALASTSLIERLNASIRNYTSRFTRQTYCFSKKLENHTHAHSIFAMYYNFVKAHRGLKEKHWTPAMKAGLTNRVWSYDDLLDEVDRYWAHKALTPNLSLVSERKYVPLSAGQASPLPYFVMHSPVKREAKVHKGSCRNCRQGVGRKDGRSRNQWYAFATERDARRCAETLAPLDNSVCSMCVVGHYVKHRVRSR
jgi:IS1 family transposase